MKKILIIILAMIALSTQARMTTTKKGYVACTSKANFEMWSASLIAKDNATLKALLSRRSCIMLKPGVRVNLIDTDWGRAIFIYQGFKFHTYIEALN